MSIYNSDANNSSFSIIGNNTPSSSSRSSRGSRGSGRSGRSGKSSNLLNTSAQIGSNLPDEAPNVVGLSRIAAINTLVADGFGYSISYTTASATSENNDTVASQSMADLVVVLNVYQYVIPNIPLQYLVVAGGGGGGACSISGIGYDSAGGGGGGGVRSSITGFNSGGGSLAESPLSVVPGTQINILIGAGGPGDSGGREAYNGSNSSLSSIVSIGGGGGGTVGSSGKSDGQSGGSGGGAAWHSFFNRSEDVGLGTNGQGYNGGLAGTRSGGGGGGAGGVGSNGSGSTGGNGGLPLTLNLGDGTRNVAQGGQGSSGTQSANGALGAGGGGGGSGAQSGANGNAGIVIIRYPDTYNDPSGWVNLYSSTTAGGYKIYTFTSNGSITF